VEPIAARADVIHSDVSACNYGYRADGRIQWPGPS